jgi:hypothetical protein
MPQKPRMQLDMDEPHIVCSLIEEGCEGCKYRKRTYPYCSATEEQKVAIESEYRKNLIS